MLETNQAQVVSDIRGIDELIAQTDPANVVMLRGAYPQKNGLQARINGKSLEYSKPYPIRGIAVFYLVYGRRYLLLDGLDITIDPLEFDPFTFDWRLPFDPDGYDDFESYLLGAINLLGLGNWPSGNIGHLADALPQGFDDFNSYTLGPITSLTHYDSDVTLVFLPGFIQPAVLRGYDTFESYTLGSISSLNAGVETENFVFDDGKIELV